MSENFELYRQSLPPIQALSDFFKEHPKLAIGFSGGCDSSFLLCAAKQANADVRPYFIKTQFHPSFEYEDALKVVKMLDISMTTLEFDVLSNAEICANPQNRCYFCKRMLFGKIVEQAKQDGYEVVCDGTNASDDIDDRPGFKALEELGVISPLRSCGLTKQLIRHLSGLCGLHTSAKPAYACLATRFPTNTQLTAAGLLRIENAEFRLMELGFSDFRIRVFHNAARIQFRASEWHRASNMRAQIRETLEDLFELIFFDTELR